MGVAIGNLGGGSPLVNIAAASAEPSAELSPKVPNVATTSLTLTTFPP